VKTATCKRNWPGSFFQVEDENQMPVVQFELRNLCIHDYGQFVYCLLFVVLSLGVCCYFGTR
jgi:hypothetical protein